MRWADEQQLGRNSIHDRHSGAGGCARAYMSATRATWAVAFLLLTCLVPSASADGAMDAWAQFTLAPKVWKGQTVAAPDHVARPDAAFNACHSSSWPAHAHLPIRSSRRQAQTLLSALDAAYAALARLGWPVPWPDGGYGSTLGFDLYVADTGCDACAHVDDPIAWTDFDSAQTYAVLDSASAAFDAAPCVLSALTQAGLRAADPSEAESWVRAGGELAAWLTTGEPGCSDSFVAGQRTAADGLLNDELGSAAAGALFLAVVSERRGSDDGEFVRGLWETTRQRSHGLVAADRLRSSPDLWEALAQTLRVHGVELQDELIEFAVARYFAGPAQRRAQAGYAVLRALPESAGVPLTAELTASATAHHLRPNTELAALGTAYVHVDIPLISGRRDAAAAADATELRVWLKGELGPDWSLTAVRLAADGRELGRTSAPARRVPSSYLPIALEAETRSVLLVIVNLSEAIPDADRPGPGPHGYELVIASASP